MQVAAGLCYVSALLAAFGALVPWHRGGGLPGLLLALAVALPPLRWPIPVALLAPVRGVGVALFLSAALGSGLMTQGLAAWVSVASLCWAYVLWSVAALVAPAFNARWPRSALDAGPWPWLGLGFIAVGLVDVGGGPGAFALRLLIASGYLFILLGRSAWPGWAWAAVSIIALIDVLIPTASVVEFLQWLLIGLSIWANVLLYAGRSWQTYGAGIASRMGWGKHDLAAPFTAAASLGIGLGFLALGVCVWDALLLSFPGVRGGQAGFVIILSLTLALSMGHSRTSVGLHGLVAALAGLWLGVYLMLASSPTARGGRIRSPGVCGDVVSPAYRPARTVDFASLLCPGHRHGHSVAGPILERPGARAAPDPRRGDRSRRRSRRRDRAARLADGGARDDDRVPARLAVRLRSGGCSAPATALVRPGACAPRSWAPTPRVVYRKRAFDR